MNPSAFVLTKKSSGITPRLHGSRGQNEDCVNQVTVYYGNDFNTKYTKTEGTLKKYCKSWESDRCNTISSYKSIKIKFE